MTAIRGLGIASSLLWCVVVAAGFFSPKTLAFACPVVLIATYAELSLRSPSLRRIEITTDVKLFAAFVAFAIASLTWTPAAATAVPDLVYFVLIAVCAYGCFNALILQPRLISNRFARATHVGFAIGVAYLAVRLHTNGLSERYILKSLGLTNIKINYGEVTRCVTPVTLLLGPAAMWAMQALRSPWNVVSAVALALLAVYVVAISPHETSKLAIVTWAVAFVLSFAFTAFIRRLLVASWIAAFLLVVPLAIAARNAELQHAAWLQPTAQQRILIWDVFARRTLEAPVLGHGFNSTRSIRPEIPDLLNLWYLHKKISVPADIGVFRADHPHNAYLQIWFELGAVGAALICALGLLVFLRLDRLSQQSRYMLATFAAAQVILLSSYGAWQSWFAAMFAVCAYACAASIGTQNPSKSE